MSQTNYTPILIYASGTTGNTPSAGSLTNSSGGSEIAINYFDGKLFYKDASNVVQVLATKATATIGGSNTQIQYNSSGSLAGSANLVFDGTNLGVGTSSPSYLVSLGGNSARTVGMERHTTANTAGNNLTLLAGGATSGATDKNGGTLSLSSGTATGSGSSGIVFNTATAGAAGTTDRTVSQKMVLNGNGNLGIGDTNPTGAKLSVQLRNNDPAATANAVSGYVSADVYPGTATTTAGRFVNANYGTAYGIYAQTTTVDAAYGANYAAYLNCVGAIYGNSYGFYAVNNQPNLAGPGIAYGGYINVTSGSAGTLGSTYGLYVSNAATTGASAYGLYVNSTTGATTTIPLLVAVGGSEVLRVSSAGNLGIGTSSPGTKLDVRGTGTTALSFVQNTSSFAGGTNFTTPHILINSGNDTTGNVTRLGMSVGSGAQVYLDALMESSSTVYSSLLFRTRGVDGAGERMRIDSSGNLGIGTTAPSTKLDVVGVITTRSDSFAAIRFKSVAGVDKAFLSYEDGSTSVFLNNYGSGPIVFKTVDTERARIDSSGNVGIGTTSPVGRLRLAGSSANAFPYKGAALWLTDTNAAGNKQNWAIASDADTFKVFTGTDTFSGGENAYVINRGTSSAVGDHVWYTGNSVEAARLNTSGNFVLRGGTTTANGTGITFPATQSASTDANTLDDYEEGTWTPVVGGTATYTTQTATYTKIGRMVFVACKFQINTIGTGSTTTISGLPFSGVSNAGNSLAVVYWSSTTNNVLSITASVGGTDVTFYGATTAGTSASQYTLFGNGTRVDFSGCYYV